jgi:hypothetical protein
MDEARLAFAGGGHFEPERGLLEIEAARGEFSGNVQSYAGKAKVGINWQRSGSVERSSPPRVALLRRASEGILLRATAAPNPAKLEERSRMAEREGFEPPIPLRVCRISSAVHSTTLPPLRKVMVGRCRRGALDNGWLLRLQGPIRAILGFFEMRSRRDGRSLAGLRLTGRPGGGGERLTSGAVRSCTSRETRACLDSKATFG